MLHTGILCQLLWFLLSSMNTLGDNLGQYHQVCYLGPGSVDTSICTISSHGFPSGYYISGDRYANLIRLREIVTEKDLTIQVLFDDLDLSPLSNISFYSGHDENSTVYRFTVRDRERVVHYFDEPVVIVLFSPGGRGINNWCLDHVGFKARFTIVRNTWQKRMPPFRVDAFYFSGIHGDGYVDKAFPVPVSGKSWTWYTDTIWIIQSPPGFGTYVKIINLVHSSVNVDTYLEARAGNNSESPLIIRKSRHNDLQIRAWEGAIDIVSDTDLYLRFHGMTEHGHYFKMLYTSFYRLQNTSISCEELFKRELHVPGFDCKRHSQCIPRRFVCDRLPHCADGLDEYGTICDVRLTSRLYPCRDGRRFRCGNPDLRCVFSSNECHIPEYYDLSSDCALGNNCSELGLYTPPFDLDLHGNYGTQSSWRHCFLLEWPFTSLLCVVAMGLCVLYLCYRGRFIITTNQPFSITGAGLPGRNRSAGRAPRSSARSRSYRRQVTLVFHETFHSRNNADDTSTQLAQYQESSNNANVLSPPPYDELQGPSSCDELQGPPSYELQGPSSYDELQGPSSYDELQGPPSYQAVQSPELCPLDQPPAYDQPSSPLTAIEPPTYAEAIAT